MGLALAAATLVGSTLAAAQVLVFDRGLPTAGINTPVVADKSNVLWGDTETIPEPPWRPGDDFTLAPGTYIVKTIRVWSPSFGGLSLRGGPAGGTISLQSNSYTATPVTYANGQGYQTTAGAFLQLYQIDFNVYIQINGGVTYQFFLDGPPNAEATAGEFTSPRLHASNAPLSGSPQQGADGIFLFLATDNSVLTWNSATGAGTYCPGCIGWDKVSDGNVQVFAEVIPITEAVPMPAMSGPGLAGMALLLAIAGLLAMRGRRGA